jgi:hypothetical protein
MPINRSRVLTMQAMMRDSVANKPDPSAMMATSSNMHSRTGLCLCGGREPGSLAMQPSSMLALQECSRQALTEVNVRSRGFIHRIRAGEAGGNALASDGV